VRTPRLEDIPAHATASTSTRGLVPDASFIRQHIPIAEVARKLRLEVRDRRLRCWKDATHMASIDVRHNHAKCFGCSGQPVASNIDLVVETVACDVGAALRCIAERWRVRQVRAWITTNRWGLARRLYRDYVKAAAPASLEISTERLVGSPGWAALSSSARLLAVSLLARIPCDTLSVTTTYRETRAWSGIGSRNSLARALTELRAIGLMETGVSATDEETARGWLLGRTVVRLTWASWSFQRFLEAGLTIENTALRATGHGIGRATRSSCKTPCRPLKTKRLAGPKRGFAIGSSISVSLLNQKDGAQFRVRGSQSTTDLPQARFGAGVQRDMLGEPPVGRAV